jgi:hypothetical protein
MKPSQPQFARERPPFALETPPLIKKFGLAASAGFLAALGPAGTFAHPLPTHSVRLDPLGHYTRALQSPTAREIRDAKTVWTRVPGAPFGSNGAGTAVLMTDGTVLIQDNNIHWYRLTPDSGGNYTTGTWTQAASMPSNYGPLYFADAILPDGKLIIEGGEYNFGNQVETTLGAIYDPLANTWTAVSPPSGWSSIGDAQSVVLPDGTFMLGNCCTKAQALFTESSATWTITGTGKADNNSEEGWALLPNGDVLTEDVLNGTPRQSEYYNPSTGGWANAGNTVVTLAQYTEIGPAVLQPDGNLLATGATGATALFNVSTGTWKAGPTFPTLNGRQLDVADGPASLLPNGDVLLVASPGAYETDSEFFEFTGKKLKLLPGTPNARQDSSYDFRMLPLPNGQILVTDGSDDVEIYTKGGKPKPGWEPTVTSVATTLVPGSTYSITGTYLNGFSQAGAYGDDAQAATNYPLVRITFPSGHVFYARTHDFTSMAVASPASASASFDVPATIDTGSAELEAVANGIASKPVAVTIQ